MLCSSVSAMPFDHGHHHESSLVTPASSSSHCSITARTPSPVPAGTSLHDGSLVSPTLSSNRPRHHSRSFSSESRHTLSGASFQASTSSTPGVPSPSIIIEASSPPLPSSSTLPVRSKRSPSPATKAGSNSATVANHSTGAESAFSQDQPTTPPAAPSPSSSPGIQGTSPLRREKTLEEVAEQERLLVLKQQQANRRPKMMRLTPAYSSLPNRIKGVVFGAESPQEGEGKPKDEPVEVGSIDFPTKEESVEQEQEDPGVGLQIDLGCIPTPSLQDLQGPVSTSQLDGMARDRNGNPIKPSLKSPRSSVSHFMPGRTTRSDSTPALPSNLRSAKSVPSTPTVAKAVHFDSQLEHVKVFKFKQRPTAVSRDGSPEQTETETEEEKDQFPYIWRRNQNGSNSPSVGPIPSPLQSGGSRLTSSTPPETEEQLVLRLPNFPSSTRLSVDREIFLERIFLADDLRSVKGTVQVRNMSFEKWVAIRYTLDHWATIGEVSAEYSETIKGGQADRFTFSIKLNELLNWPRGSPAHETKSMFMCLRYTVNKAEFWDNNEGLNYQLDFRKRHVPTTPLSTPTAATSNVQGTNAATAVAPRAKVFELARKGGVGGKGVFAMEDLKRELDKLRSDEEVEVEGVTVPRTFAAEMAKKTASPPASPGGPNSRSGSPSLWTARYDFGQSLRNPRSGSRSTGSGRAAALDYFSAKPTAARSGALVQKGAGAGEGTAAGGAAATFAVSIASPSPVKAGRVAQLASQSPDFSHRFGMISPGLADGPVEHKPIVSNSNVPSAETSPSPTPTPTATSHDRFYSYPPNRHSGTTTPTMANSARMSPAFFTPSASQEDLGSMEIVTPFLTNAESAGEEAKAGKAVEEGVVVEDYSPLSECGSPNPFSPSDSVSSVESDTTVSNQTTPEDRQLKARAGLPHHARRRANGSASMNLSSSASSLDTFVPLATLHRPTAEEEESERLRPASMSDYQELVNRFCWNSELVPSGGSMVPDMPTNGGLRPSTSRPAADSKTSPKVGTSPLSGGSTPTLR